MIEEKRVGKLDRASNWLWRLLNKKPPKPWESYVQVVGPWFCLGLLWGLIALLDTAVLGESRAVSWSPMMVFGLVYIHLLGVLGLVFLPREDRKGGAYQKIHEARTDTWRKNAIKSGLINEDEQHPEQATKAE